MHFKNPDILYFLFLLVVPILVHLFQLQRFKKEIFTNVRFLKKISIQTRKSSTIKKWLLLITRLLLLAFLILAFAQPFFEAKDDDNKSNEMYIVLDNSLSMQAKGKKGELLKRSVQELLESLPDNATFSVLTNADTYWNTTKKEIQNEFLNLKYSPLPFQLERNIAKIKSHKSPFKKDIIIITDAIGLEKKQLKNIDQNDNSYFIVPKAEQKNNVSIDSVFINETLENFYTIGVKLSRYGVDSNPIPLAIYNSNKLIAKTITTFETKTKTINFTIPKEAFHGYVSITENGLIYDNFYYFSISKTNKTTVLSIGDAEKSNFMSRIYTDDEFEYHNFPLSGLDYNSIEKQDAIILNELDQIPQALQTTLKSFYKKGGNIVVIPSSKSSVENINSFFQDFGKIQFKPLSNSVKQITKINFSHPLFESVFESKITNFQYPKTYSGFEMTGNLLTALYYEDESCFLTSIVNPVSAISVFSAPINTQNSNFQQSPLIVPVFYKMVTINKNSRVNAFVIGNTKPYLVDALLSKDAVLNVKNNDEKFIPTQQSYHNKVKLQFNEYPEQAGNFEIYDNNNLIEKISFNYNREESNLTNTNASLLSEYKTIENIDTIFDTLQTARTENQLWKWFVIFALLFLLTEMAIIRFLK